eukprot:TRINITY_DN3133_c0_g1_i1.p1 TRINITY_DN3133_c0_g1~~TRINITY_DN3133_c0_g1_i1.p1  ORF type:complete len:450 (+),score=82.10 TRINITY_DN3133_c0_g1_i1:60-1409(+)
MLRRQATLLTHNRSLGQAQGVFRETLKTKAARSNKAFEWDADVARELQKLRKAAKLENRGKGLNRGKTASEFRESWEYLMSQGRGMPGKYSATVALGFYTEIRLPREGIEVFRKVFSEENKLEEPDATCYLALTHAYAELGDVASVATLRAKLRSMGTTLNHRHHVAFLRCISISLSLNRNETEVSRLHMAGVRMFHEVRSSARHLDESVYLAAIRIACDPPAAMKIVKLMCNDKKTTINCLPRAIAEYLKICAKSSDIESGRTVYFGSLSLSERLHPSVHIAMLHLCSSVGDLTLAVDVLKDFKERGEATHKSTFLISQCVLLLKCCAAVPSGVRTGGVTKYAESIFQQGVALDPNQVQLWSAMLSVYCTSSNASKIESFVKEMPVVATTLVSVKLILIQGYRNCGDNNKVEMLQRDIQSSRDNIAPFPPLPEVARDKTNKPSSMRRI